MGAIWQDIKFSFRRLLKSPGFTAIALITLAIGIGANTTMFTIVDMLTFRPVKIKKSQELVCCAFVGDSYGFSGYRDYEMMCENNIVFSDIMAQDQGDSRVTLVHEKMTRQVLAMYVTSNYFSVLGITPVIGRSFLPEEERQDALAAAVLSYKTWQNLGGEPDIVGQYMTINGIRTQIIGVAPEDFTGVTIIGPDLWLPVGSYAEIAFLSRGVNIPEDRRDRFYPLISLVGRLKPGISMKAAQAQLQAIIPRLQENYPQRWSSQECSINLHKPGRIFASNYPEEERLILTIVNMTIMGISILILVIACMNLANMMIIHGANHYREITIRLALGGTRWHIVRQLLIESLLIALLGGAIGLILTFWGTRILNYWIGSIRELQIDDLRTNISIRVLAAALGFSVITAILFGLKPALGLSRTDLVTNLKESGGAMFLPAKKKKRHLSVLFQIALAVMLVMLAVLLTRSYMFTVKTDSKVRMDNKLIVELDALSTVYDRLRSVEVCESLAENLGLLFGVEAVGTSNGFIFGSGRPVTAYEYAPVEQGSESRRYLADRARSADVSIDYFAAMEIPLLQGRTFNSLDRTPDAEKVAIIDETLAHKLRPDGMALGCLIQNRLISDMYSEPYRVVGIVPNVKGISTSRETYAQIYLPLQTNGSISYFYLRLADNQSTGILKQRIKDEIRRQEPWLPIVSFETLKERYYNDVEISFSRIYTRLAIIAGTMALFLAALGIYAVRAYIVSSRTCEIGIRISLGATHRDILFMILRESIILTLEGLFVGLLLSFIIMWIIRSSDYGIISYDPVSIIIVVVILGLASLLAGFIPARRAAKIDPMEALRYE